MQGTYDRSSRSESGQGGDFLDIYDLSAKDSLSLPRRQQIVWGGELRVERDSFDNVLAAVPALFFDPAARTLVRENVFAQDALALSRALKVTLGLKLQAEKLIAYEAGYRAEPAARISLSLSLFYNDYTGLRDLEPTPGSTTRLTFANDMEGHSHGAELWGTYEIADWWRVSLGANMLREEFRFVPGSFGLGGIEQAGDDPGYQVFLRSPMDLSRGISLDASLRQIGSLPDPEVPAYTELNMGARWSLLSSLTISLSGRNLLHAHHVEFSDPPVTVDLGRSYLLSVRWRP